MVHQELINLEHLLREIIRSVELPIKLMQLQIIL